MSLLGPLQLAVAAAGTLAALTAVPYLATVIDYRHRDNGLAYILLVLGVTVWNGMVVVQILAQEPVVKGFFLALTAVGALLTGLGWFLFASTASSTPTVPNQGLVYGALSVLVGLDIALAITAPIHDVYWLLSVAATRATGFAIVDPGIAYWLHTELLFGLFLAGAGLFGLAWRRGISVRYTRAYTLAGTLVALSLLGSNVHSPGGLTIAPVTATLLTTIGWLQARRGSSAGLRETVRAAFVGNR